MDASQGTVCLVSDDSDFAKVILDIHHSGWKVAVVSSPNSWTLRRRSDYWMDWTEFCASLPGTGTAAPAYSFHGMEVLRDNVDISAHAVANSNRRVWRDMRSRDHRFRKTSDDN